EVRVEQGRPLPPERLERSASAALGRLVDQLGLRLGDPGRREQWGRHGRGKAETDHHLHEAATAQTPGLDVGDQLLQSVLIHGNPPWCPRAGAPRCRVWLW